MIRMLFRKAGYNIFHTVEINDKAKEAALMDHAEVIGFEDCRQQVGIPASALKSFLTTQTKWKPDLINLSQFGLDELKDEIARREILANRTENLPQVPAHEVGPEKGFLVPDELQPAIEKIFREDIESVIPNAPAVDPFSAENAVVTPTELWLLQDAKTQQYVKSTTDEGGESFIAFTSFEQADKAAKHQAIFDIECTPVRLL